MERFEEAIAEREEGARRSAAEVVKQVATTKALLEGGDLDGAEKAYGEAFAADAENAEALGDRGRRGVSAVHP